MPEDVDFARTFKRPRPGTRAAPVTSCSYCWSVLDKDSTCFKCQHGCWRGCGPISRYDFSCPMCGDTTFRCPGESCKSALHHGAAA